MNRYKRAIARATSYTLICPYKKCGIGIPLEPSSVSKGDLVKCPNCRKQIRISRVR